MAGLNYFLAGKGKVEQGDLAELGLGEVFRGGGIHQRAVEAAVGPGGTTGVMFRPQEPAGVKWPVLGCWPAGDARREARQSWSVASEGRLLWVGHYACDVPTPGDLARAELIDGHRVVLRDGAEWLVPVARGVFGSTSVPQVLRVGLDGKLVYELDPRFGEFCEQAGRFWEMLEAQAEEKKSPTYHLEDWFGLAVMALAINYRVDVRGVSHLGLLDTYCAPRVLGAVIDLPTRVKVAAELEEKKKPPTGGGSSSSSGGTGS